MKTELRQRFRAVLAAMSKEVMEAKSAAGAKRLLACPEFREAQVVMVFLSLPTEINTTPIALRAWQERKRVAAPKVSWEQKRMLAVEIRSLTDDVAESTLGIHEPIGGAPIPPGEIDLVIVPGLGFDHYGNRLGRGRGFYDQFLAHPEFRGVACAYAFDEQVTDAVPVGPQDQPVDMLVTDGRLLRFTDRRLRRS